MVGGVICLPMWESGEVDPCKVRRMNRMSRDPIGTFPYFSDITSQFTMCIYLFNINVTSNSYEMG